LPIELSAQPAIDAAARDAELLGDRRGTQLGAQLPDLSRVDADGSAFVFSGDDRTPRTTAIVSIRKNSDGASFI